MLKKLDYALIIILIIFAIAFNFIFVEMKAQGNSDELVVTVHGDVYATYPLSKDGIYTVTTGNNDENVNTFQIKDGIVSMLDANCPDGYCIHSKSIENNSEIIVCLPHELILEIVSDDKIDESGIDSLAQ